MSKITFSQSLLIFLILSTFIRPVSGKKKIEIQFRESVGKKYYEVMWLENESSASGKIEKFNQSPIISELDPNIYFFKLRTVFSEEIKTAWSKLIRLASTSTNIEKPAKKPKEILAKKNEIKRKKIIDPERLEESNNAYAQQRIKILAPFYFVNNDLWVTKKSSLAFIPTYHPGQIKTKIYYRLRYPSETDTPFQLYEDAIPFSKLSHSQERRVVLDYFLVRDDRYRSQINTTMVNLDSKGPSIEVNPTKKYEWKLSDKNYPIMINVFENGVSVKDKDENMDGVYRYYPEESDSEIHLIVVDSLNNKTEWKNFEVKKQ